MSWIKLHRSILEWEWFGDSNSLKLFLYCLIKANFEKKEWRGHTVDRGQFITSLEALANDCGMSVQKTRTCLQRLEKSKNLTRKTTNKFTILTVCNYESYQVEIEASNKQTNKQITNKNGHLSHCDYEGYESLKNVNQQATNRLANNNEEYKSNIPLSLDCERSKEGLTKKTPVSSAANAAHFKAPTIDEVQAYIQEKNYTAVIAETFWNYYESVGWFVGKKKMKNWKSAISGWESRNKASFKNASNYSGKSGLPRETYTSKEQRVTMAMQKALSDYQNAQKGDGFKELDYFGEEADDV